MLLYQVIVNEESATATNEFITRRLNAIKSQRKSGELEDLALVIGEQDYNSFNFDFSNEIY